jgi:hypothetical protein
MLSFRDIEDLLAERGVMVSYESILLWCHKFGPAYARRISRCAWSGAQSLPSGSSLNARAALPTVPCTFVFDLATDHSLNDSPVHHLGEMPVPDESTVCRFRHLLEAHALGKKLFEQVHAYLEWH